jgi:serine/threonine-protein kinase
MGAVAAVTRLDTGERYAVKVLAAELEGTPQMLQRFRREARVLDSIDHPAIVRIHDCGESGDGVFIVMELLSGETLQERLGSVGRMTAEDLAPIVDGLCYALAAIHRAGIVHRDLKPGNVFLPTGGGPAVKLIDFGSAKGDGADRITQTGQIVGTLRYMAPEQLTGGRIDERTDVYAVGAIAYRALSGRPPFPREWYPAVRAILQGAAPPLSGVGHEIAAVIDRAMAATPAQRFTDVRSFAAAFRAAVSATRRATPAPGADTRSTISQGSAPQGRGWNMRVVALAWAACLVLGFGGTAVALHVTSDTRAVSVGEPEHGVVLSDP